MPRPHGEPSRRPVLIGPESIELCRTVGPTAWAVLVEMAQRSTGDGDEIVAQVSIRTLAASVGIAKDTAARAVRRLRRVGLIAAVQSRTSTGAFDVGTYRLSVPSAAISAVSSSLPPAARPSGRCPRPDFGQLALPLEA